MIDDISLLCGICIGLAVWVLHLQHKVSRLEKYASMYLMLIHAVADGKTTLSRDKDGVVEITMKESEE